MTPCVRHVAAVAALAPLMTLFPAAPAPAAEWRAPVTVAHAPAGGHVTLSDLAVGTSGDAVTAWVATRPGAYQVRVATRSAHGEWSRSRAVSGWFRWSASGPTSYGGRPSVAVDARGAVTVAWSQASGGTVRVRTVSRPAARTWGRARWLSPPGKLAVDPEVVGSTAATVVTWLQGRPFGDPQVRVSYRARSGPWSDAGRLDRGPWVPVGTTVGVVDHAGVATLAWDESSTHRNVGGRVQVATYLPGSGWSETTLFRRTNHAHQPQLAVTADGTVTAAWADYKQVLVARRPPGGAWTPPERVFTVGSTAIPDLVGVGVTATGTTYVGWMLLDLDTGFRNAMLSTQAAAGAAWTRERVSKPAAEPFLTPFFPRFAANRRGGVAMTWQVQSHEAHRWYRVYVRHRSPSGAWDRPVRVGRVASQVDLAADRGGNLTVQWLEGRHTRAEDSCCTSVRSRLLPAG
ncbi:MAG: hypothetical protein ABIO16_15825 [Nocardioides sp.]